MLIEKKELMEILSIVKPGLAKKGIIEQFTHFIFTGSEIMTYNDEICISHPFKTDFKCSVKADDFYKSLNAIKQHTVKIYVEGNELRIDTKETRGGLSIIQGGDAEELIKILDLQNIKWTNLPGEVTETEDHRGEDFLAGIFLCMFSCSKDMTQGVLTCIHIKKNCLLSSDEIRISRYVMEQPLLIETFIPARSASELIKLSIREVCLTDNWLHFRTGAGATFSSRIMDGKYPDIESFLEVEGTRLRLPSSLKEEIESISFMSDTEVDLDKLIDLNISPGKIVCKSKKTIGWIEKEVEFKYQGEPVNIQINPIFFSQVLEKATITKVSDAAASFTSGNFKHSISLV